MNPSDPSLNVGDLVALRSEATLPLHCHIVPGTVGRILFIDDSESAAVTVQFANSGRPVRLLRRDLMGLAGSPPETAPAEERIMDDQPLQAGDLVLILATTEQPRGQPPAPRRYGRVLDVADEDGRVAVEVEGRQHPLHLPAAQLRRVAPHARWSE